ncbi:TetR family transcriptional regulator [Agrobacterium vitis]|nr:TetR/AcrR family transcriptional regulator [Agrobacterium vitis]MVA78628.1 TetR family transcriptional regulator [Agrobacterium vitis]
MTMSDEQPAKIKPTRVGRPRLGAEVGREAILSKAIHAFGRQGFDGVNLRDLARQAGVNIALANYHFGSKAALWEACLERMNLRATPCISTLQAISAAPLAYSQKMADFYAAFIRFNADLPDYGLFILQEMVQEGPRQEQVKASLIDPFHDATVPLLLEGMDLGLVHRQDASLLFFTHSITISHVLAGQGTMAFFLQPEDRREQTLKDILAMIIRSAVGVLPDEFELAIASANPDA